MRKKHYMLLAGLVLSIAAAIFFFDPKRPPADDYARSVTHAMAGEDTPLGRAVAPRALSHRGESGFMLLSRGKDSLQWRLAAIEAAQRSLDIQYYMIENDNTGKLLLEAMLRAADRGVRVRILMDDLNLRGADPTWPLLNAHSHIEIRIFNPFATRDEPVFTRVSNVFTGLGQFSKRMHNKILVADNTLAIAGGRNLGDEYFDASGDFNFRDVDMLAVGPIVASMSRSFDSYWNGDEAFPLAALHPTPDNPQAVSGLRGLLQRHWQEEHIAARAPVAGQLQHGEVPLVWAKAELAVDAPSKINLPKEQVGSKPGLLLNRMAAKAKQEFIIVSPYFVPGEGGTEALKALVDKNISVKVLTNSLASSDAVAAHTGYRRYRQALVEGGVELYELKPAPGAHPHSSRFGSSSLSSLHSKIYVVDRRDVIVGSFNLDPRSVTLNTEMLLVIHSPELAGQVITMFEKATRPSASFHVVLQGKQLEWVSTEEGQEQREGAEPDAGLWRRIKVNLFSLLPLENQV